MRYKALLMIVITTLFLGWLIVLPVSAADGTKLDIGIYEECNPKDNPIQERPFDQTGFSLYVTWVEEKWAGDDLMSKMVTPVGYFESTQDIPAHFPIDIGVPYHDTYCAGIKVLGICMGTEITMSGYYHIDHHMIPPGYCPQYPQGQSRKKTDTQTSNIKYYYGDVCKELYPGFRGLWGTCAGWNRCVIRIV